MSMLKEILDIININYLLGLFVFIWLFKDVIKDIRVTRRIKTFPNYMGVLEFHMEKAFEMVYKERIFIYSLEATKPSEDEIDAASKDFVMLVQKLLGPTMQQEFINMYGGIEAFTFIMLEWFHRKFEDDEIRRSAVESYMNQDEEITP